MSDESALLAAIRAAPADDAPRLVYADWLDEHGQPERAEFIRVQIALARTDDSALRRREAELLAAYHDTFAGPLAAPHLRFRFERGFAVAFGHTGVFAPVHPGSHPRMPHLVLRFFVRGAVHYTVLRAPGISGPEIAWIRHEAQRWPYGVYKVEPTAVPPTIEFTVSEASDLIQYVGTIDGPRITLDGRHTIGRGWFRHQLVHHPIPGFDSFPET
jgi:uncharacterized protein (TIGR02996 family)